MIIVLQPFPDHALADGFDIIAKAKHFVDRGLQAHWFGCFFIDDARDLYEFSSKAELHSLSFR
jgi:hypothetical protein